MFRFGDDRGTLKCSFCGKNQDQVRKLIAGPGVYICDECIELCNEIIEEELSRSTEDPVRFRNLPKPKEINQILDQYVIGQKRPKRTLLGSGLQPLQAHSHEDRSGSRAAKRSSYRRVMFC